MELADKEPGERITINHVCESFLQDATARGLRKPSLDRYDPLFTRLKAFAVAEGLRYINQIDLDTLRRFRAGWTAKNYGARNELERLRALFRFAHDAGWITDNPARKLKAPRIESTPSLPFTKDEMACILAACEAGEVKAVRYRPNNVLPMKAFVLVLRYSGLRIRDVVTLSRDKISDGMLFLRTAKTGTHVRLPLPPACLDALAMIPTVNQFYFWSGHGSPKTRVSNFQYALKQIFKKAGIVHGFAHRFRDTFAVELLLANVPIDRVAIMLGHQNIKVTQLHYNPFVASRQEQIERDARLSW